MLSGELLGNLQLLLLLKLIPRKLLYRRPEAQHLPEEEPQHGVDE